MKNKIITIVFIIVAIVALSLVRSMYSDYNLERTIQACIVAQKQTSKSFNLEESREYCKKEIKKNVQKK
tara:strand:+ start:133 stop:339 length:207 start_codon:yes stop_codon:yes gene_type:complete